jgi:hypothetical protein
MLPFIFIVIYDNICFLKFLIFLFCDYFLIPSLRSQIIIYICNELKIQKSRRIHRGLWKEVRKWSPRIGLSM